ncbi:MAG: 16S rRNA (guanine(966)-N(2))-methyltransferase RsmD [Lachnospiraceae bacterium]|nr:16S rRNA (guanine(966)-N(2))-methyltransferase RsmD [Lachnospiraceae bacterium]
MRVIAGSAKRKSLVCPSGKDTRPTTDRIKETLFNMLQPEISSDTRFLDLFSGSGGIGIEALSRGAKRCIFVERGREALRCIRKNLENTGFSEKAQVLSMDVMQALKYLSGREEPFDIIFLDPPYEAGFEDAVIPFLMSSALVSPNTLVILETSSGGMKKVETADYYQYLERCKNYKTNCHLFFRKTMGSDGM